MQCNRTPRQSGKGFWQRALRHRSFMAGGVLTLFVISAALLSMVWTPWPAYEIDIAHKLKPPSASHWIGTDMLGRDIISLLLVGARSSIAVGVIAVASRSGWLRPPAGGGWRR